MTIPATLPSLGLAWCRCPQRHEGNACLHGRTKTPGRRKRDILTTLKTPSSNYIRQNPNHCTPSTARGCCLLECIILSPLTSITDILGDDGPRHTARGLTHQPDYLMHRKPQQLSRSMFLLVVAPLPPIRLQTCASSSTWFGAPCKRFNKDTLYDGLISRQDGVPCADHSVSCAGQTCSFSLWLLGHR